jgi:inosose dehydratase
VISIVTDAYAWVPGDADWDVGVPEVSDRESVPRPAKARSQFAPSSVWESEDESQTWNCPDRLVERRPCGTVDDVSLEECLRQASVAGFTGMETGRRFPMDMAELGPILARYGISVCGGWFSGLLLDGDIEVEKDRIAAAACLLQGGQGAPCIVYGETARSVQGVKSAPLATKPKLTEAEMAAMAARSAISPTGARERHAAQLPPPHGRRHRDRGRTGPLHEAFHRAAAVRRGPHGLCRRRQCCGSSTTTKRITHVHTKDIRRP